jgi:hypothetical protein
VINDYIDDVFGAPPLKTADAAGRAPIEAVGD